MAANPNQKGGEISGGAVNEEVLASYSRTLLAANALRLRALPPTLDCEEISDLYESGNVSDGPAFCFDITYIDGTERRTYNVEITGPPYEENSGS